MIETPKLSIDELIEDRNGKLLCKKHRGNTYVNDDGTYGCPKCTNEALGDWRANTRAERENTQGADDADSD